jgi:hypothetical protein
MTFAGPAAFRPEVLNGDAAKVEGVSPLPPAKFNCGWAETLSFAPNKDKGANSEGDILLPKMLPKMLPGVEVGVRCRDDTPVPIDAAAIEGAESGLGAEGVTTLPSNGGVFGRVSLLPDDWRSWSISFFIVGPDRIEGDAVRDFDKVGEAKGSASPGLLPNTEAEARGELLAGRVLGRPENAEGSAGGFTGTGEEITEDTPAGVPTGVVLAEVGGRGRFAAKGSIGLGVEEMGPGEEGDDGRRALFAFGVKDGDPGVGWDDWRTGSGDCGGEAPSLSPECDAELSDWSFDGENDSSSFSLADSSSNKSWDPPELSERNDCVSSIASPSSTLEWSSSTAVGTAIGGDEGTFPGEGAAAAGVAEDPDDIRSSLTDSSLTAGRGGVRRSRFTLSPSGICCVGVWDGGELAAKESLSSTAAGEASGVGWVTMGASDWPPWLAFGVGISGASVLLSSAAAKIDGRPQVCCLALKHLAMPVGLADQPPT